MRRASGLILIVMAAILTACAGDQARDKILAPAVVGVWPSIKADAEAGIASRDEPDSTKALRIERLTQFDEAIRQLGG